jgi:pimeloyl-ACP methyl ester carboxylesterase
MTAGVKLPGTIEPMHVWLGSDGNSIAGDVWGDPAGPLVILQHGGGQTRHAWKGAGERLGAAGYRAVALDARGHGDSAWAADGRYDQDAMIGDVKSVIAALDDRKPVLVGASMGGANSLVAVGEGTIQASALVLVDVAARIEREGAERILAFMTQKPDGFDSLEEAADAIANYQPHRKRPPSLDGLAKNLRLDQGGKFRWHWDPKFSLSFNELDARQLRYEAAARAVTVPTLVVRGGISDVLSEEGLRHFQAVCPHAQVANIANAGHMIAGDRNDVFADSVIDFLSAVMNPLTRSYDGPI